MNKMNFLAIGLCTFSLSSCTTYEVSSAPTYETYSYSGTQFYTQDYYQANNPNYNYKYFSGYNYSDRPTQQVSVPDSYHVGEYHSPVSFKDRDRTWVTGQNPQGYTIEVADDEKASQVAQKLYKAPKNDRMAQVKYQKNGKQYYKGLYGTYNNAEDAQKALDALPPEIKQGAGIKNWGSVQNNLNQ